MKYPLTPAGIERATIRFVAQHLNHCATAEPQNKVGDYENKVEREANWERVMPG